MNAVLNDGGCQGRPDGCQRKKCSACIAHSLSAPPLGGFFAQNAQCKQHQPRLQQHAGSQSACVPRQPLSQRKKAAENHSQKQRMGGLTQDLALELQYLSGGIPEQIAWEAQQQHRRPKRKNDQSIGPSGAADSLFPRRIRTVQPCGCPKDH